MFWLGKIVLALGQTDREALIAMRVLSALMAGLTIIITYAITRQLGGNANTALLSGLLLICVNALPHNARFAHNDTYLIFFTTLTVLFLVNYQKTNQRGWLYASFLTVGMAASSKYNGIALVIVPGLLYLFYYGRALLKFQMPALEVLFISGALTVGGFVVGTPKALTWMAFYFKRMIPALLHTGNYARQPDSVRGMIGQYGVLLDGLGIPLFLIFSAGLLWAAYHAIMPLWKKESRATKANRFIIPLLAILALDLPIMISYNYQLRFFLPLLPMQAILAAFLIEHLRKIFEQYNRRLIILPGAALGAIIMYSLAGNISVMLLFFNDARIPASAYIASLPADTSLEFTYYPPSLPENHFSRNHSYPIYFSKSADDPFPTSPYFEFNVGEIGLDDRQTDYLVTDNFTYDRFSDPYICGNVQVECDFFKQLDTGQSNHYKLIAEFSYTLPPYVPQIKIAFVNPVIRVYERIK
jgi:4-amino-4-deoxy-L-arabinose transferase-like glycosyltransferase